MYSKFISCHIWPWTCSNSSIDICTALWHVKNLVAFAKLCYSYIMLYLYILKYYSTRISINFNYSNIAHSWQHVIWETRLCMVMLENEWTWSLCCRTTSQHYISAYLHLAFMAAMGGNFWVQWYATTAVYSTMMYYDTLRHRLTDWTRSCCGVDQDMISWFMIDLIRETRFSLKNPRS